MRATEAMEDMKRRSKLSTNKLKVYLTVSMILIGAILGGIAASITTESSASRGNGILIDFDDYDVTWYSYDLNSCSDPTELLKKACEAKSYTYTFKDGILTGINGYDNNGTKQWALWYIESGQTEWVRSNTYNINVKDYAAVAWAYRGADATPTVAVDSTGTYIYGYQQASRIVTLSPVASETVGALKATSSTVGADCYSNYPTSLLKAKESGKVSVVGTYTDPNYESILKTSPDMVIADGSQYNQVQMANNLRKANINSIVLYEGEDIKTIYDNTYIIGVAIGYELTAKEVIQNDEDGIKEISDKCSSRTTSKKNVMIALSPDASPYVAGNYTYINDILTKLNANNSYSSANGWSHVNTETIAVKNPDVIIIVTESYQPTEEEWNTMYNSLSDTWRSTKAYQNKEIYLLCSKAVDLASRASPRCPQLEELLGEIIYPEDFGYQSMPKYIGDNYTDYLTITKYLGYDN